MTLSYPDKTNIWFCLYTIRPFTSYCFSFDLNKKKYIYILPRKKNFKSLYSNQWNVCIIISLWRYTQKAIVKKCNINLVSSHCLKKFDKWIREPSIWCTTALVNDHHRNQITLFFSNSIFKNRQKHINFLSSNVKKFN